MRDEALTGRSPVAAAPAVANSKDRADLDECQMDNDDEAEQNEEELPKEEDASINVD